MVALSGLVTHSEARASLKLLGGMMLGLSSKFGQDRRKKGKAVATRAAMKSQIEQETETLYLDYGTW